MSVCVCKSIFIKRARSLQWRRAIKNQIALPATVPSSSSGSSTNNKNNNNLNLFKVQLAAVALLVVCASDFSSCFSSSSSRATKVEWALVLNLALPLPRPLLLLSLPLSTLVPALCPCSAPPLCRLQLLRQCRNAVASCISQMQSQLSFILQRAHFLISERRDRDATYASCRQCSSSSSSSYRPPAEKLPIPVGAVAVALPTRAPLLMMMIALQLPLSTS